MLMKGQFCALHKVALWLLIIGGLNLGFYGIFGVDTIMSLLRGVPIVITIIYILIGLSAVLVLFQDECKTCKQ